MDCWFQSTTSRMPRGSSRRSSFNPRLRMGATVVLGATTSVCFNPRLRMGGDYCGHRRPEFSIHASAWEATSDSATRTGRSRGFNPRLRMGGDRAGWQTGYSHLCFNPRLRMGGDKVTRISVLSSTKFQSTPPHGRRRTRSAATITLVTFQSTPPHGRRLHVNLEGFAQEGVSIHASAWEAT